jgi:hypothetical protein
MTSSLDAVYEKYKHLDGCLSDPGWCTSGEGAAIYAIAGELWRSVKEAREQQQEIIPSADIIADLERSLEFYRTRMNNLQCWQSSMRDPERKIVCDILANGFTLTTKEEIDNAGNPCEESGCTDIENCDEICQHSRIYSPVQMQQAIAQATKAENKRLLDRVESGISAYEKEHENQQVKDECRGMYIPINIVRRLMAVRSLAQPGPKEREPE